MSEQEETGGAALRRGPLKAALLSLCAPGLGQIYLGQLRTGLAFMILALTGLAFATSPPGYAPAAFLAGTVLVLTALLAAPLAAVFRAVRHRHCVRRRYHRWWVFAGFWLGVTLLYNVLIETSTVQPFSVSSTSQAPTLLPGDRVAAERLSAAQAATRLRRGDLVLFKNPTGGESILVKRVVALPGDSVAVADGQVSVNDRALPLRSAGSYELESGRFAVHAEQLPDGASYPVLWREKGREQWHMDDLQRQTVREGHIVVLGDMRDNSWDSRRFGQVPTDSVIGRMQFVWWARDLNRIGATLRPRRQRPSRQTAGTDALPPS